ncbi:MAG: cbb3-type cytochrome c oxidase subunit I [Flavobacteriales bacterium]
MLLTSSSNGIFSQPGIIGTLVLIGIVLFVAVLVISARVQRMIAFLRRERDPRLRRTVRDNNFQLRGDELGGTQASDDPRGLVERAVMEPDIPLVDEKKKVRQRLEVAPELRRVIVWYLAAATSWLVFGTLVGQYVGMKFAWPDMDEVAWLSFGRLRPVHTNTVFWGWASLAMIGLGYFVVARTSATRIHSYKLAWRAWWLINLSIVSGNLCLMAGINNGGGEYREYIWPAMLPFAIGLFLTFRNFYRTVAARKIGEIYISNWYILAALVWTLVLATIGYLPWYQEGLGETVIQGYYMHQGVGMWFMTFTLGLLYYYLPSALNKPIYSYSLGVLAFWTQMLFYTMIGTHHFVFAPLPWWLQTVAIVFSAGMFIPVVAGTTNFLMTMRGSWSAIGSSYVLPFFLVAVIFYFVGSTQGSLQAFRFTNHVWHFTDFNVAHSHMTMYGIITFALWACVYAILPRITGREPAQLLVGAHFWTAFIGLFAYMISLMAGGTIKGLQWIDGMPFIDTVTSMRPYWIWRAIGGSLMFLSHLLFAWNFFTMARGTREKKAAAPEPVST